MPSSMTTCITFEQQEQRKYNLVNVDFMAELIRCKPLIVTCVMQFKSKQEFLV